MEKINFTDKVYTAIQKKSMPLYIPRKRAYSEGYCLAVWNLGLGRQNLWDLIRNTRITIRKDGKPVYVVKKGNA